MRPRVTHQDIADHLGISRVSVTQALHETRRSTLSPELQNRILQAAHQLDYRPRNISTHTIAVVGTTQSLALVGEMRFLHLIDEAVRQAGFRMMLANVSGGVLDPLRRQLTAKTVDGVIFSRWFDGRIQNLLPAEIPWLVTSDEDGIPADVDQVTMATKATARSMAEHLLRLGHRRLALLTGLSNINYHGHLKAGTRDAVNDFAPQGASLKLIEANLDCEIKAPLLALMKSSDAPTAIIASSPEQTITVMSLLCASGYKVPRDVSVMSFLDSHLLESLTPAVTATTAGIESTRVAVQRLIERIRESSQPAEKLLFPGAIIARASVAPPKSQ